MCIYSTFEANDHLQLFCHSQLCLLEIHFATFGPKKLRHLWISESFDWVLRTCVVCDLTVSSSEKKLHTHSKQPIQIWLGIYMHIYICIYTYYTWVLIGCLFFLWTQHCCLAVSCSGVPMLHDRFGLWLLWPHRWKSHPLKLGLLMGCPSGGCLKKMPKTTATWWQTCLQHS